MGPFSMSRKEREAFLAQTHVGIVTVEQTGRGPLAAPVWYRWDDERSAIRFSTEGSSRKAEALRKAGRATFVVQVESLPYKYVTIEGPVTLTEDFDKKIEVDDVARRYLGVEQGNAYLATVEAGLEAGGTILVVHLAPEHWATVDQSKMPPS